MVLSANIRHPLSFGSPRSILSVTIWDVFCLSPNWYYGTQLTGMLDHLVIAPEDSPYLPDDGQESVVMLNKDGNNFLCFLPKAERAIKPVTHRNTSNLLVETEKWVKLKMPDELLEVLKNQCFIRQEGWWSYEFCYQKHLRQLHLEEDKVVQEFVLGVCDEEASQATAAFNQNLSDISTLFQEERLVWYTINCNILPKETEVDDTRITMVVESDDQPEISLVKVKSIKASKPSSAACFGIDEDGSSVEQLFGIIHGKGKDSQRRCFLQRIPRLTALVFLDSDDQIGFDLSLFLLRMIKLVLIKVCFGFDSIKSV
ncbi:hypothetical protein V6N12_075565 [Hibiscus sabdariffa]|uniref:Protein OS9-like domain-containing protein n=1 Tax=Hibiscus sabdariffa TaxID=183260 RepID=A0ABR2C7Y3_9ROSI